MAGRTTWGRSCFTYAIVVDPDTDYSAADLLRTLVSESVEVHDMRRLSPSLEEIFFGHTKEKSYEEVAR